MSRLAWPCAHCGGAFHEPLTMAAKRHANDPRAVLVAFRALADGRAVGGADRRGGAEGGAVSATRAQPYVGQAIPRLEDDALLRGEGRFIDDLDPVPHTRPRRRSSARPSPTRASRRWTSRPRARTRASSASSPPRRSSRCRARSRRASRAVLPHYAAANDAARFVGEPVAVVVAESATWPRTPPSWSRSSTNRSTSRRSRCTSAASPTATSTPRSPRPTRSSRRRFVFPRWSCTPVECYGVVADWRGDGADRLGELPGPVHAPRRRGGRAGHPGGEAAPADAARLRRLVRHQGRRVRVRRAARPRLARARRARALDRGPARAPVGERACKRARDRRSRPRFAADGELLGTPLRRARGRRRLRARTRAGDALPHARLALGRLPRPQRRRAQPSSRSRTAARRGSTAASAGPQLYFPLERTMDIAAARLGLDPAELRRRNLVRDVPVHARRAARPTTRATTSPVSRRRSTPSATRRAAPSRPRVGGSGSASPASSSRRCRTWATSRSPRRPRNERRRCRSRATSRAASSPSARTAASRCASPRRRRARDTAP